MKNKYWIFALMSVVIWGVASVLLRLTFDSFSSITLVTARVWLAAITMIIICRVKKLPPPRLRDFPIFLAGGAIGYAVYLVVQYIGFIYVTAATGNVVLASTTLFTALIALVVFREKIRPLGWLFSGVSFAGLLILVFWNGVLSINIGIVYHLIAALLFSGYCLIQRLMTQRYTAIQCCAYSMTAGAIIMTPFLPDAIRDIAAAPPSAVVTFIYLGTIASGISFTFWSKAFALAKRTADVSNFLFLPPFVASIVAYAFFGELPDWGTVIGGVIIIFGLWMFQKKA